MREAPKGTPRLTGFMLTAAAFVIVVAGMKSAQPVLVPFLLSAFLAVVSAPALSWLVRRGVPEVLAIPSLILGILGMGSGVVMVVGSSINDFVKSVPIYQEKLNKTVSGVLTWLQGHGVEVPTEVVDYFDPGAAMGMAASILTELGSLLTDTFLILLTVIFMLLETSGFSKKVKAIVGSKSGVLASLERFTGSVKQYMAIKTSVSLLTGVLVAVWLLILGVKYPLLWGLLAFLLNYVPNLGSIIAAVPAVLLAIIQVSPGTALLTAIGYVAVNVVVGNVIEPRFMGSGLGLSTLVVFFSLVFWGWVLGPVGMLLSVPLTMTLKIALESSEETRSFAILLGDGKELDPIEEDIEAEAPSA